MADEKPMRLRLHLVGGQTIEELDHSIEDADHVEEIVSEPPRPHWARLGDTFVFTQALAAVEVIV